MRILVTGGAGYIGSHATRLFCGQGHEVWVFDNLSCGHRQAVPEGRLIVGDLADRAALEGILREKKIDAVVHFAAFTYVGESVKNPQKYYENNISNSLSLFSAMRQAGVSRIVFSSTAATYGAPLKSPITEDEPQKPINPYGRAKLAIEWALEDYAAAYGWGYAALRYFNASGAHPTGDIGEDHDPETHLIPIILQVALGQRSQLEVFGTDYDTPDGTCVRDYIHVDDLAAAHLAALDRLSPGRAILCNLGTGQGYTVREVVAACEQVTGARIKLHEAPRRAGDPPVLVAAPGKAMRDLAWQPRFQDLASIVETAWRWHQSHPRGYAKR